MTVQRFEIDTIREDESLEEVEIFDGDEDFDGHIPVKPEKPTCQIKVLKILFGIGTLLMVFSFGYKLGTDEMAKNPFFTPSPTSRPTRPPVTRAPTGSPSMSPTMPTEGPTISPTNETDSNSTRILSDLVNPFTLTDITQEDVNAWKEQFKSLSLTVELLEGDEKKQSAMYRKACEKYMKPTPVTPRDTLGWIQMLCRYYMPLGDMCGLTLPVSPKPAFLSGKQGAEEGAAQENLERYTRMLAGKIKRKEKLRVATFGTSVMAGQDNCYNSTFAPTFQRALSRVTGLEVEIFNLAQNGDGDAMSQQLICSDSMLDLDSIDMIVAYWDMTPQSKKDIHKEILNQWLHKGILVTFLSEEPKWLQKQWDYAKSGVQFVTLRHADRNPDRYGNKEMFPGIPGYSKLNPWYRNVGGHWGKHDTGRCHLKTREGFDGILMQNWHPGALTNQLYSDVVIFQILMAMNRIQDSSDQKQEPVGIPKPQKSPVCVINHGDMPSKKYNLLDARVSNSENPYKERHESDLSSWEFNVVKRSSNMGGCKDLDVGSEKKNHACNAHVDTNYGFVVKSPNQWITVKLQDSPGGYLRVCRPNIKRQGMGVSADSLELWVNNKQYAIERVEGVCVKTTELVPKNQELYVSVRSNSIGFAFNSISIF